MSAQASIEVSVDFNGDGFDDVDIAAPHEDVDIGAITIEDTGAFNVIYRSCNGLSTTSPRPDQIWTQNSPDVNGEAGDQDFLGTYH